MKEVLQQTPTWALMVGITVLLSIIGLMTGLLAFFLVRFIKSNDDAWTETKKEIGEIAKSVHLLVYKVAENEDDIRELASEVHGRPYVKQKK